MTLLSIDVEENEMMERRSVENETRANGGGIRGKCMESAGGGAQRELFDGFPVD